MNPNLIDFGMIQIKWYSFFILVGMLIAFFIILKETNKKNIPMDFMENLLFYSILIGILGARIYYVIFNLNYYLNNPLQIFMVWNGGLAIHGGILGAFIFIYFYCKKKNIELLKILDILVVGLIIAQSIGRWGNFFNGEAYGRIVSLDFLRSLHLPQFIINGMFIDGQYREPTFLYESIFSLLGFISLLLIRKTKKLKIGQLTGVYLLWYGVERIIIETFRSDSLMLGPIKIAQLVSLFLIICGIYLVFIYRKKQELYNK